MKIKIKAHVFFQKYSWEEEGEYQLFFTRVDDDDSRTWVCEQEVEIEVPDNYDFRAQQVAALNTQLQKVRAENHMRENAILDRISKLQALEYTA